MISLIIAGGIAMATTAKPTEWPDVENHLLAGDVIPGSQVVCRDRWGTPMLPDGKGGYSLIAPINQTWIMDSLMIPPDFPRGLVAYRPLPSVVEMVVETPAAIPEPATVMPPAETDSASLDIAPVEPTLPDTDANAPASDDASAPAMDASTPMPDESTPAPDESTPAPDASTPAPDASTPAPDASTPTPDASTPTPDASTPAPDTPVAPVQ